MSLIRHFKSFLWSSYVFLVSLIFRYLRVFIAILNGILFFVTYLLVVMYLSYWEYFISYFEKWIQNKNTELILFLLYKKLGVPNSWHYKINRKMQAFIKENSSVGEEGTALFMLKQRLQT